MAERILTTHVGSLPRPREVVDLVFALDDGQEVDTERYDRVLREAVAECVCRQVEAGVDLVSDGEMSKIGYATYIRHRLSGFELGEVPRATPADLDAYPRLRDRLAAAGATARYKRPICRGPVAYEQREPLDGDLARLADALAHAGAGAAGAFMNAPSPGIIALFAPNEHYATVDEYLDALGAAMRTEYEAIVAAGLVLQVDAPDLAMGRHIAYRDRSEEEFLAGARRRVEVLNNALRGIPPERIRLHLCWGNYEGPHHLDIGVEKLIETVLAARPATIVFEAANPRHAHEWAVWREAPIPDSTVLAPGVIDSTTNYIEHPELVAQRLEAYGAIVGRERLLAATDCGFGTWAGFGAVDPDICWAKLRTLAEGAARASARLA
jgi:5-methyltetrahydropteroyltriglutamate--homocysteine methyltransferase